MDAIVLLKDDHKVVEKLFKEFEKAGDTAYAKKRKIVDQVIKELTTHAYIEEKIFYPTAREACPDDRRARAGERGGAPRGGLDAVRAERAWTRRTSGSTPR